VIVTKVYETSCFVSPSQSPVDAS